MLRLLQLSSRSAPAALLATLIALPPCTSTADTLSAPNGAADANGVNVATMQAETETASNSASVAAPAGGAPAEGATAERWRFSLAPYLWVPAISGTLGVNGTSTEIDVTQREAFDLLSDLDGAFALHFEAAYGKLALFLDGMYYAVEANQTDPMAGALKLKVGSGIFEAGAAYRLVDLPVDSDESIRLVLEPLAGVRVLYVDSELTVFAADKVFSGDKTWVNAMFGCRGRLSFFDDAVGLFGRGDFGFGAGSDSSWNAVVGLDLRVAHWCSILGGYRWFGIDFSDDTAAGPFIYDVVEEGPFLAAEFRF